MNAQVQHSDLTPNAAPPVSAGSAPESSKTSVGDGMLNTSFGQSRIAQPQAASEFAAPLTLKASAETEYVPFYQRFAEHVSNLNPISRLGGAMFTGMAIGELLLASTCTVSPLTHLAFAGVSALLAASYLSGARDRTRSS